MVMNRTPFAVLAACLFASPTLAQDSVYLGTVRASDMNGLSYGARGCIVALSDEAKRGQTAQAGQMLVRLDDEAATLALRTSQARVMDLEAALAERQLDLDATIADNARRAQELAFVAEELERNTTLFGRGIINETTLEGVERRIMDAEFASERAAEAIASAQSAKRRAEIALEIGQLDLKVAELALEDLSLVAPFDGVLVNFEENVGDCVQEGELAAQLYAPAEKAVDIYVLISDLAEDKEGGIALNASVAIRRNAGDTCAGVVTRIDTEADLESQFVRASIDVDGSCAPALFLNEAVEVTLADEGA